jgi:nucleoside-diphosphate-sugar epimerase
VKAKRILITGGAGFIGTHLAERFSRSAEVILFDSFRRDSLMWVPQLRDNPNVKVITGDVLAPASIAAALEGVDTVLHAAAIAGVSSYYNESLRTLQVNILGTANVLAAAVDAKVQRYVQFSTSEIFGAHALWVTEESPANIGPVTDKRWVYATSKLAGEHLALRTGETHGMACTAVRPFNIYGPRQVGEGAISNFCRAAAQGKPLIVQGDGSALRAWCYVEDFVDAIEAIIETDAAAGHAFNIGNPSEVETTTGLARRVVALVPGTTLQREPQRGAEVRARIPKIDLARDILGFEPKVDLQEGLRRTYEWFSASIRQESEVAR